MKQQLPQINHAMVAFIDILGFRSRLFSVAADEDLLKLYADLRTVHKIFDKDPSDSLTKGAHEALNKRVISLSDALVVSIDLGSKSALILGDLDTLASELCMLAWLQAVAVIEGFFVRGGIALGYYFISDEGDVILSNAMASAYERESEAHYPVLALDKSFHRYFVEHPGNDAYSEKNTPKDSLIKTYIHPKTGEEIAFLDYFQIAHDWTNDWYCNEDIVRYKEEKDETKKQKIFGDSCGRSRLRFVMAHKKAIQVELAKNYPENIMEKYNWLKEYHNKSVNMLGYSSDSNTRI